jgi:hypothetical protein
MASCASESKALRLAVDQRSWISRARLFVPAALENRKPVAWRNARAN